MHTQIKKNIIKIAEENPTEEICGFLYHTFHELKIYPCKNIAEDKADHFEIDNIEYLNCLKLGKICGIYHSHPDKSDFSQDDLDSAEEIALPIYVYGLGDKKFCEFIPKTYTLPLEGLEYVWGDTDCYGIVRIYFRQKYGIYLKDYDREESYIYDEKDVITENFEKENFIKVIDGTIKKDDILVFSSTLARPQHFIIFLGNSRGLHHPLGKLSKIEPIKSYIKLKYILRYKGDKNAATI